jgi:hypothetical protein
MIVLRNVPPKPSVTFLLHTAPIQAVVAEVVVLMIKEDVVVADEEDAVIVIRGMIKTVRIHLPIPIKFLTKHGWNSLIT